MTPNKIKKELFKIYYEIVTTPKVAYVVAENTLDAGNKLEKHITENYAGEPISILKIKSIELKGEVIL